MDYSNTVKVVIVGGGFAGLNAAKHLAGKPGISVVLIDQKNHHLFQPLLYQVATAALNPADIATPIRAIFSPYRNVEVLMGTVKTVDFESNTVKTDIGDITYDYLILAAGATHSYFGNDHWETHAPGLKSLEEATEIRRRILTAFELAETTKDKTIQKQLLTFIIVGGGPTGVELAGALGEITRYTMSRDFRNIDPKRTRIILIEGGPRILPAFDSDLSERATRDLENLGVSIWTDSIVTNVNEEGVTIGDEEIKASTVIWAAGVGAPPLNRALQVECDRVGRIVVNADLSVPGHPNVFTAGDQASFKEKGKNIPLPGIAPVAIQQGEFLANQILNEIAGKPRSEFTYHDKGIMATIGRERAIVQTKKLKLTGFFAWLSWLIIHIMYLIGFRNRFVVGIQWFWSYVTFRRGSRLITARSCRLVRNMPDPENHPIKKQLTGSSQPPVKKKVSRKTAKKKG